MRHQIRWTAEKIFRRLELIEAQTYRQSFKIIPFRCKYLNSPLDSPPGAVDIDDSDWDIIQVHEYWANPRMNFILRAVFDTGNLDLGAGPIALSLPIGIAGDFSHPEALIYIDGESLTACDRHHQEFLLPKKFCDGREHSLELHGWTGIGGSTVGDMTSRLKMNPSHVVQIDKPTRDLAILVRVTYGISQQLDERDPTKHHLLTAIDEALKLLDIRNPIGKAFYESVPAALVNLREGIDKAGHPLDVEIFAIGHAHIDLAWLWTLDQTRRKAGRTFHTVMRLMEQFPGYIFGQSQPQLYDFVRQDYPDLFENIQARVAEGRWETIGGMWVEADCNLSGPESLVRQFLLGRSFFHKYFGEGVDSPILWLPDVFGYAWNLPQLIKEAGLNYFFTIKIGWSQYNRLPYDSFWWQGLDGTKVLTHFSTTKDPDSTFTATYNADASPGQTIGTWINFQQKDYGAVGEIPPLLMSYGYGDGGGGPTREMLENIQEMGEFPSTPRIRPSKVVDFFRNLEERGENLPTWNGELYLEYHRGTYTTQARNKKANRESEFLLHDAEFLATYTSILDSDYQYPGGKFTEAWQLVCLNQFHDIIPSSSIAPVYTESLEQYSLVQQMVEEICETALTVIAAHFNTKKLLINPAPFHRTEQVTINGKLVDTGELPPYSVCIYNENIRNEITKSVAIQDSSSGFILENTCLRVEINKAGDITRIYDKVINREVLPRGAIANQFQAFEDIPLSADAWDIDIFFDDKMWLAEPATSIKIVDEGPLRATLEISRHILNSDYTQTISLSHNSTRLDFFTLINWKERQILLKVAFPVDILSPKATYEIQWGNVERSTHQNTSWDWARFETAAQKWVDLSEGDYGVSLLNNCKYGHDIKDNIMRLSLLRGTTIPDPLADFGEHEFTYSLYPHSGSWDEKTVAEAYALNDPVIVYCSEEINLEEYRNNNPSLGSFAGQAFILCNRSNIVIETIKRSEDGNGIIVRLYECQRQRSSFELMTIFPVFTAWRTNILEENREEIPVTDNQLQYHIKPYQVLTLRIIPDSN